MTENIQNLQKLLNHVKKYRPLIHCITNPISIHDCANVVLAAGGRPIMAEHPQEVAQITEKSQALMLNLGNITDARMESMKYSLIAANENGIPVLLDLVGIACSDLRKNYAKELLQMGKVSVLKGNMSEILEMAGEVSHSIGIDAGAQDALTSDNLENIIRCFRKLEERSGAVILASGKEDLVVDAKSAYLVGNGDRMMSEITGTGCMLGAACSTFLAGVGKKNDDEGYEFRAVDAVLLGTVMMGIAGETAVEHCAGPGTFQAGFLDCLYRIGVDEIIRKRKIKIV